MHVGFLTNKTRKKVLAANGKVLRSIFTKAVGAMFFGLPGSYVFVFDREQTIAITNVFVFEQLDIVWLDKSWRVVDLHERLKPFALHTANKKAAQYVLELPGGTLKATGTRLGDVVTCRDFINKNAKEAV
jgi:uncharacterized membrane protein (UPF0127 family)